MKHNARAYGLAAFIFLCIGLSLVVKGYYAGTYLYAFFLIIPLIVTGFWYPRLVLPLTGLMALASGIIEIVYYDGVLSESIFRVLSLVLAGGIIFLLARYGADPLPEEQAPGLAASIDELKGTQMHLQIQLDKLVAQNENMRRLISLSFRDSLTGLYNRTYFEQEMRRLEEDFSEPVGLIICDVDGLKLVNDNLGHDAGDELLKNTATIITRCFREKDVIARIGGDEFAVLMTGTNPETLASARQRLKEAIREFNKRQARIPVSFSVGSAVKMDKGKTMTMLFREADTSMYREKPQNREEYRQIFQKFLQKETPMILTPEP